MEGLKYHNVMIYYTTSLSAYNTRPLHFDFNKGKHLYTYGLLINHFSI